MALLTIEVDHNVAFHAWQGHQGVESVLHFTFISSSLAEKSVSMVVQKWNWLTFRQFLALDLKQPFVGRNLPFLIKVEGLSRDFKFNHKAAQLPSRCSFQSARPIKAISNLLSF